MKKYLALTFIGIFLLAACSKGETAPAPSAPSSNSSNTEQTTETTTPSTVDVQTSLFEKAVAERNEEECKKIEDAGQRKSCITLVQQSKEQDKTFSQ